MKRTQIQLPDEVYDRARKHCEAQAISLSELARRGIEYMLSTDISGPGDDRPWQPPKPRQLGWTGLNDAEIKLESQRSI